jgi:hypothetical protein
MQTIVSSSMFNRIGKRLRERHEEMRNTRKVRLTTIRHDIDRVVREEAAFTSKLVKELFPLEIEVKEGFFDNMPIKVKAKDGLVDMFNSDDAKSAAKEDDTELAPTLD